jgi:7-cyano-7-deazaguanine synthase
VDLRALGGSALTADIAVPKDRDAIGGDVPITYVPARNMLLLALLTGMAEVVGALDLVIGANVQDFSGYPDCRPGFLRAFAEVATLGTGIGVGGGRFVVHAPLLQLTKAGIVRLASQLGVDLGLTLSCYDPPAPLVHCGRCDACRLRRAGFAEAGVRDPSTYQS